MADAEVGENGFPLEKPAEPATVPHVVQERTSLSDLADRLGLTLEHLWKHNQELRGWTVHKRTQQRDHVVDVMPGTIVHLPPGTVVAEPEEPEESEPTPVGKGNKGGA